MVGNEIIKEYEIFGLGGRRALKMVNEERDGRVHFGTLSFPASTSTKYL